jgi:hypothetical protein
MSHFHCTKLSVQVRCCFVTQYALWRGFISCSLILQVRRRLIAGCSRLLVPYIRSCLPYGRPFLHPQSEDVCRVVETRTHLSQSNCNECKIYNLHRLKLVGLGVAVLVNEVTIVVICYGEVSTSPGCCKSDVGESYFVDIMLEF